MIKVILYAALVLAAWSQVQAVSPGGTCTVWSDATCSMDQSEEFSVPSHNSQYGTTYKSFKCNVNAAGCKNVDGDGACSGCEGTVAAGTCAVLNVGRVCIGPT